MKFNIEAISNILNRINGDINNKTTLLEMNEV